jgi:hypothetical protein
VDGQQPIAALTALTKLQHLEVVTRKGLRWGRSSNRVLRSLTSLTNLRFELDYDAAQAWRWQLSRLHNLRELSIRDHLGFTPSTTPGLSQLTALTSLRLECVWLDPAVLSDISTQLQSLNIGEGVRLEGPVGPDIDAAIKDRAARLLSCIAGMTRLQQLRLNPLSLDLPAEAAPYTALTASSNLQRLELCDIGWPDGIWQTLFPDGQTWPHLRVRKECADGELAVGQANYGCASCRLAGSLTLHAYAVCFSAPASLHLTCDVSC